MIYACRLSALAFAWFALESIAVAQLAESDAPNVLRASENRATAEQDAEASRSFVERAEQPAATPPLLSREEIEARLGKVDSLSLTEAEKQEAKSYYQDALQANVELVQQQTRRKTWAGEAQTDEEVQQALAETKKKIRAPIEDIVDVVAENLKSSTVQQLEELVSKLERQVAHFSKHVKSAEAAPQKRAQRLAEIPEEIQKAESALEEAFDALQEIAQRGVANEVIAAKQVWLVQKVARLETELAAVKLERTAYERDQPLDEPRLMLARRELEHYQEALEAARAALVSKRKATADDKIQDSKRLSERNKELFDRNVVLRQEAEFNEKLATAMKQLVTQGQAVTIEIEEAEARFESLSDDLEAIETQFGERSGVSEAGGQWLRRKRAALPRVPELQRSIASRAAELNQMSFDLFEATQRLRAIDDIDEGVAEILRQVASDDQQEAKPVVRNLLEKRRNYLRSLIHDYGKYGEKLSTLRAANQQLIDVTRDFDAFIAQRELWIRSCQPLAPGYASAAQGAVTWSLDPANWWGALSDVGRAARRQPLLAAAMSSLFLVLMFVQRRARRQIRELGEIAAKKTCCEFLPTLRTAWLTLVISLAWPALLWSIARLLEGPWVETEFTRSLARALSVVGMILLVSEGLRQTCRAGGLAEAHLGWPAAALQQLRRYLRWTPMVIVPLVIWLVGLDVQTSEPLWGAALGRLLFMIVMFLLALVTWRLLMQDGSAVYQTIRRTTDNWLLKAHRVWRPLLFCLPVLLALLAGSGYYYTAQQLALRSLWTAGLLIGLMIAGGLLRRWVLLNRRQLALQQARQRRAQAAAHSEGGETQPIAMTEIAAEESVDLSALSDQTRKLLRNFLILAGVLGVFAIWQDVFPALAWLDKANITWLPMSSVEHPTSWGHVMRSLLVAVVTFVAVRHLPSLLELFVLQHLPIDQGARYAIATLVRYALLAVGIVIAAATLGITGTSLSWLVAAMSVGLGFGLQEIFANFVSGIILLFERPIRVGDIVTLGNTSGIVTRIRMRATTIIDWDRKEYVVPNKDLVTDRLLNWTLTDQTNRVVINVGIAYGTDTENACALLREIATAHPDVLDDPATLITFEGFGDSTLNLVMRAYLPNLDRRLAVIHELHTEINKRFKEADIEIAFPQRDLHVRSIPPEWAARGLAPPANGKQTEKSPVAAS